MVKSNSVVEHRGKKIAVGLLCRGASINQIEQKESIWSVALYCSQSNAESSFDHRSH
ncbi:MAG: hypothetical protein QS721_11250 [Candidatus Endonucleobacter sp. (ex Gigantidas childressi)]|nr:hypothetical protein [Candidatus Endonucleobacter sp. (ex Gigantidas childressi)]